MLKAMNKVAKTGPEVQYGCTGRDVCVFCDTRDGCRACDREWCTLWDND